MQPNPSASTLKCVFLLKLTFRERWLRCRAVERGWRIGNRRKHRESRVPLPRALAYVTLGVPSARAKTLY